MRFEPLFSGSAGNAYIVSDGETRLLIEAGVTYKKLLRATNFDIPKHAVISHEHNDHACCINSLIKDGATVYMSMGTARACDVDAVEIVSHGEQFSVGTFDVVPFTTFHDANEPLGFLIKSKVDGDILVFATDTASMGYKFPGVTIWALEANFDQEILDGKWRIHETLKRRIAATHMEISKLCEFLQTQDLSKTREVWLCHLSDYNSNEIDFLKRVARAVPPGIQVTACPK